MENTEKNNRNLINIYRNELKYYISYKDYIYLKNALKKTMYIDKNGDENQEYWIRSLYFDTLLNSDFNDKMIGIMNRKKIRLRLYDIDQENIKIEIKNKFNQYMLKETSIISRRDSLELIDGNREVLLNYKNPIMNKVYYYFSKDYYKPSAIIDYEREAYTYPIENIRITFDKNIRTNTINYDIYNKNLNMISVFDTPKMVVEIKYNKILPSWIRNILSNIHTDKDAISKYCLGRIKF